MNKMERRYSLNAGGVVCFVVVLYSVYYILLRDSLLPFSISAILASIRHWFRHWHLLSAGFLPIYLALMVFGVSLLGLYLGSALQRWVARIFYHKSIPNR